MNPEVDVFFSKIQKWQAEMETLRTIILDCGLIEELKWKVPCYTFQQKNIVLIHGFKAYCAISFFKGALLSDPEGVLIQQTENVQSGRQIRFTTLDEILEMKALLNAYIYEAIELEKAGLKVTFQKSSDQHIPEELESKFANDPSFKTAFYALTPGRQRGYVLYFSGSKQAKTREARIEKYTQRILAGIGFNDCTCGLSKRFPNCDGSHKTIQREKTT